MASCYPLVRGKVMRLTNLSECCAPPAAGAANSFVVSKGFISVSIEPVINEPAAIEVLNANGETCVYDEPCPEFRQYDVDIEFCEVDACALSMLTGVRQELGPAVGTPAVAPTVGFRQPEGTVNCDTRFSLEVWAGIPGEECGDDTVPEYGYLLLPCLANGVLSSGIEVSNGAATFTVSANTRFKAGHNWGAGPYNVVETDAAGTPGVLPVPMASDEHLLMRSTKVPPPTVGACGCHPFPATLPFAGNAPAA